MSYIKVVSIILGIFVMTLIFGSSIKAQLEPLHNVIGPTAIPLLVLFGFCLSRFMQLQKTSNANERQTLIAAVHHHAQAAATVGTLGTFLALSSLDKDQDMLILIGQALNSTILGMMICLIFTYLIPQIDGGSLEQRQQEGQERQAM